MTLRVTGVVVEYTLLKIRGLVSAGPEVCITNPDDCCGGSGSGSGSGAVESACCPNPLPDTLLFGVSNDSVLGVCDCLGGDYSPDGNMPVVWNASSGAWESIRMDICGYADAYWSITCDAENNCFLARPRTAGNDHICGFDGLFWLVLSISSCDPLHAATDTPALASDCCGASATYISGVLVAPL